MKKKDEYKVVESNYFLNDKEENDVEKTVFTGNLEECKEWISHKFDSYDLLEEFKEKGIDVREFILNYLYDPEEHGIFVGGGLIRGSRESFGMDQLEEFFMNNHPGRYDYLLGIDNKPVLFQYGYTEND